MRPCMAGLLAGGSLRAVGLPGYPVALLTARSPRTVAGAAVVEGPRFGLTRPHSHLIPDALHHVGNHAPTLCAFVAGLARLNPTTAGVIAALFAGAGASGGGI